MLEYSASLKFTSILWNASCVIQGFLISNGRDATVIDTRRSVYLCSDPTSCREPHTIGIFSRPFPSMVGIYSSFLDISPYFRQRVGYTKSVSPRNAAPTDLIPSNYRGRIRFQSNIWLWAYCHLRAWAGHRCRYYPEEGARKYMLCKSPVQFRAYASSRINSWMPLQSPTFSA